MIRTRSDAFLFLEKICSAHGLECTVVHEAALAIWEIDWNALIDTVDILVRETDRDKWKAAAKNISNAKIRVWTKADLKLESGFETVGTEYEHIRALHPKHILDTIGMSPDRQSLYEQRARLAEVFYVDLMSDETLEEFHRYVRGA